MRDPAVILIERAHQSPKCNTHGPLSRATPSCLPRHALPAHFVLTSVKRDAGPTARRGVFFFSSFIAVRSRLASIISYASLNKSARTAITIDTARPPPLCPRRSSHLFRPARTHTHGHHDSARDRFVKYEDFNQKGDGIRARISDENYRDADSEELMIDATGEWGRRSLKMSWPRYSVSFCVTNERMNVRRPGFVNAAIPSVCATRLATKIDKRAGLEGDRATRKNIREKRIPFRCCRLACFV